MKTKYLLLLIGLALALPMTRARAQVVSATTSGIVGSVHDFTTIKGGTTNFGWNTADEATCQVCHTPHNADVTTLAGQGVPLWVHQTTKATYTLFADPSGEMTAAGVTPGQPNGISLACLSCHDGTVAINQNVSGLAGAQHGDTPAAYTGPTLGTIGSYLVVTGSTSNPTLQGTHPISIPYPTNSVIGKFIQPTTTNLNSVAQLDLGLASGDIWPGNTTSATATIANLLYGPTNTVECSSCHDVHRQIGDSPGDHFLLKIGTQDFDKTGRGDTLCRTCHIK
jgi:hypothetical protein